MLTKPLLKDGQSIFSLFHKEKDKIHPAELANIINDLPEEWAIKSFDEIKEANKPSVFTYLGDHMQDIIIDAIPDEQVSIILNSVESDHRLDFFNRLKPSQRGKYLILLNEKKRKSTQDFLGYPENSVARIINTDFATITEDMTIEEVFSHLRNHYKDSDVINTIYIEDKNGRLVDDMPLRRLILNTPEQQISGIMDRTYVALNIADTKETAVTKFKEYDRITMPVVNDENIILGIITVDDILDVMEDEESSAAQKFGAVEELDYPYVKTSFFSLIEKRAGWLIILFLGEMFTATAMSYFEDEIATAVVLALFIPLVISSGGNSGSQAATLIIRAMALKELTVKDWWYVMRREILSGLTLGVILGAIGFIRIALWQYMGWYDYGEHWILIALTIFLSLTGIVCWGTITGSMIPIILKRLNLDPATSSAPFVATLVDVTGLIIYFSIAAMVLSGTIL